LSRERSPLAIVASHKVFKPESLFSGKRRLPGMKRTRSIFGVDRVHPAQTSIFLAVLAGQECPSGPLTLHVSFLIGGPRDTTHCLNGTAKPLLAALDQLERELLLRNAIDRQQNHGSAFFFAQHFPSVQALRAAPQSRVQKRHLAIFEDGIAL
jgi:hypothetical protein